MKQFTDYVVNWNPQCNSGIIKFFTPSTTHSMCTKEIGQRDILMMIDLMQTKGIQEFFIRFDVLLAPCKEKGEFEEVLG